jgi:hypothetical protein
MKRSEKANYMKRSFCYNRGHTIRNRADIVNSKWLFDTQVGLKRVRADEDDLDNGPESRDTKRHKQSEKMRH